MIRKLNKSSLQYAAMSIFKQSEEFENIQISLLCNSLNSFKYTTYQ